MPDRFLTAALVLILTAGPGAAQDWFTIESDPNAAIGGGAVCTQDPGAGSFCLTVGCLPGRPLGFYIASPALSIAAPGLEVSIEGGSGNLLSAMMSVDGQKIAPVWFSAEPDHGDLFSTDLARDVVARLLDPLRSGNRFAFDFSGDGNGLTLSGPLAGSTGAIATAMQTCPAPREPTIADPEAVARAAAAGDCNGMREDVVFDRPLARPVDLDGVPPMDMVVDMGGARCAGSGGFYCGSGGCSHSLYLGDPAGGYHRIFNDTIYGIEPGPPGTVTVSAHGSACDRVGAAGCTLTYRIENGAMTLLRKE